MRYASGFLAAALAALVLASESATAVSLRPNKATDDSVCDLTHDTNAFLTSKVLVPAAADQKDQVEALVRLAGEFVSANCRDGQILLLEGSSEVGADPRSLTEVANMACAVAMIERTEIKRAVGERSKFGFQLRCPISKHERLTKNLADRERTESMPALKARMYSKVQEEHGTSPSGTTQADKDKCGRMTLSSLLAGGNCK